MTTHKMYLGIFLSNFIDSINKSPQIFSLRVGETRFNVILYKKMFNDILCRKINNPLSPKS